MLFPKISEISKPTFVSFTLPWLFPEFRKSLVNVGLACSDHLIGYFYKQSCHSFRGVVILGYTVDHSYGIHQTWYMFNHFRLWITRRMGEHNKKTRGISLLNNDQP